MTTRLDLYSLQVFLAVLEEGSIAAAAVREHIAPSALSKRLSELERTLDVTLFQRLRVALSPPAQPKRWHGALSRVVFWPDGVVVWPI